MEKEAAKKRKIPNRSEILIKEEDKTPLAEIIKKIKGKKASEDEEIEAYKRWKMNTTLADFNKMSRKRAKPMEEENDGDITLMEEENDGDINVFKKIKRRRSPRSRRRSPIYVKKIVIRTPIPNKDKGMEIIEMSSSSPVTEKGEEIVELSSSSPVPKKDKGVDIVEKTSSSPVDDKESCFLGAGKLFDKSSEEDSEEEKKHIRRSPFWIKGFSDYVKLESCGTKVKKKKKPEPESDEELLRECDRNEIDHSYNYVLKKRFRAITNPINPQRYYYRSGKNHGPIKHVLHDPDHPLATFSKLALKTYNDIQGTQYEYVGLVKAYMEFIGGWHFWIRFKARVVGQDAINFESTIFEAIRDRETNVVPVHVGSVYPLPP